MKTSRLIAIVLVILLSISLLAGCQKADPEKTENPQTPTEEKQPEDYTWEDYNALTEEEKQAFRDNFQSEEEFDNWKLEAQFGTDEKPWETEGAKQPSEYTWAEFEALSPAQQLAFQNSFESTEALEAWMQAAQFGAEENPWEAEGAKQPSEYTWAEFEALSPAQQMAFQNCFESTDAFEAWMMAARFSTEGNPWEAEGAKQPSEYTWAEYEALSIAQQMAFQSSFGSIEAFDQWLRANYKAEQE